jgi:hypothetical protein
MQLCGIYSRKGSIFVVSHSITEFGIGLSVGPMYEVSSLSPTDVGKAIFAALDASRSGIPQPGSMAPIQEELYRFTRSKGWSHLARTSAYAEVTRDALSITVTGHKLGEGGAFVPDGPGVSCATADFDGVGREVLKALKVAATD